MSPPSPSSTSVSLPSSNALLALPDGAIPPSHPDRSSNLVSIIGGYPTFPSTTSLAKAPESIRCGVCHQPIPLLAQVYCPPEGGENDRTVYVWACAKSSCQRRDGSVRAFRASARNEEYARDAAEKKAEADRIAAEERERSKKNPFTMPDPSAAGSSLFGAGQSLFGAMSDSNPFASSTTGTKPPDIAKLSLDTAPSSSTTTLAPPLPAYQPVQYLSTMDEYLPDPEDEDLPEDDDDEQTAAEKAEWRDERWEQLLPKHMDEVFERFVRRLQSADGAANQVLRYDLGGVPLPYSSKSPIYHKIFPGAPTTKTPDEEEEPDFAAFYSTATIPKCSSCGGKRVFELQLVPSLISVLTPDTLTTTGEVSVKKGKMSEEERKKELARIAADIKGESTEKDREADMEWGSVLVFGCEKDCVGIVEEYVAVEWETQLSQQFQQLEQQHQAAKSQS